MEISLSTPVQVDFLPSPIEPSDKIMVLGSCFAEHIGTKLIDHGLKGVVNPFGIVYNPISVVNTLEALLDAKEFSENEVFEQDGFYKSYFFHSRYTAPTLDNCLRQMNERCLISASLLRQVKKIIITLGTSYVFKLRGENCVVANCHKTEASKFERVLLTCHDIESAFISLINKIRILNPEVEFIFTVSPIRHLRDGAHENQISKAILLLAVNSLQHKVERCYYFPAYEIMLDELRDYRFYKEDMVHPSSLAVTYIAKRFQEHCCSVACRDMFNKLLEIRKASQHRWNKPTPIQIEHFVNLQFQKINILEKCYPHLDLTQERHYFQSLLL